MSKSPKTGREVEEQRVRRGPAFVSNFVRSLAKDSDNGDE